MSALGKVLSEPGRDFRQLFQRSQSSAEHGPQIQASEADPRPREPRHNRHPIQKAVESIAAESRTAPSPFGPERETTLRTQKPTTATEVLVIRWRTLKRMNRFAITL